MFGDQDSDPAVQNALGVILRRPAFSLGKEKEKEKDKDKAGTQVGSKKGPHVSPIRPASRTKARTGASSKSGT